MQEHFGGRTMTQKDKTKEELIEEIRLLQKRIAELETADTESKKSEESLRLAQLGKLVSAMAHEVNNPLMIISGNAQLSLMEGTKEGEIKDSFKIIFEECQRAKGIIQRIVKISQPS